MIAKKRETIHKKNYFESHLRKVIKFNNKKKLYHEKKFLVIKKIETVMIQKKEGKIRYLIQG